MPQNKLQNFYLMVIFLPNALTLIITILFHLFIEPKSMQKSPLLTGLFVLTIFLLIAILSVPLQSLPDPIMIFASTQDKTSHILVFLLLTMLSRCCLRVSLLKRGLILMAIAGVSEFIQTWIPYRDSNIDDFQANIVGIYWGIAVIFIFGQVSQFISRRYEIGYSG